jgi:hypothetical protein
MYISVIDIEKAYRKLKSYIYHDNTSLFIRRKIAQYERSPEFKNSIINLAKVLSDLESQSSRNYMNSLIDKLDSYVMPKKLEFIEFEKDESVITNTSKFDKLKISNLSYFVNSSIELHIISTLWIIKVGYLLEKDIPQNSYACKLEIDSHTGAINEGLKLYKRYHLQYQNWRDNGIDEVRKLINNKKNAAMITLDIKDFFHSVRFDFDILNSYLEKYNEGIIYKPLTDLLRRIYSRYTQLFISKSINKTLLPIGFLSSGILANWYLREFDHNVIKYVHPMYYGRYVDDILIVIDAPDCTNSVNHYDKMTNNEKKSKLDNFINNYFLRKPGKLLDNHDNGCYKINGYDDLIIQPDKIKLYIFDAEESTSVLDQIVNNIRKNSSEFRFLPEEESIKSDFEDAAYSITYNDSVNKLRSIDQYKFDKYGASKYLAQQIFSSRLWEVDGDSRTKTAGQILSVFKGRNCLEYYTLWEKITTYFVVGNLGDEFTKFCLEAVNCINKIDDAILSIEKNSFFKSEDKLKQGLKDCLLQYLRISMAMPISLNLEFYDAQMREKLKKTKFNLRTAKKIRNSNMLRHSYVFFPLFNYTRLLFNEKISLLNRNLKNYLHDNKDFRELELKEGKLANYSPRFIHLHEITEFTINKRIFSSETSTENKIFLEKDDFFNNYHTEAFDLFFKLNYSFGINDRNILTSLKETIKSKYPIVDYKYVGENNSIKYNQICIGNYNSSIDRLDSTNPLDYKHKLLIGIANTRIEESDISKNYNHNPNLSNERIQNLFKILNMVEKENCDIFIMPECSIPYAWLSIVAKYCQNSQKALVCGLEHYIAPGNIAYNFIVTILPFKVDGYKSTFIKIRLKNHYSPDETKEIRNIGYIVPVPVPYSYDLFVWNGIFFSCFYCYELADIKHRSIFRSKVDLLIASEWNKDTNYFSSIIESTCRDIHCYFVQVNNSYYGDLRILQPAKTEKKNIIQLKGGENCTLLTGTIDIKALREFQQKSLDAQKDHETFKQTPPDFHRIL